MELNQLEDRWAGMLSIGVVTRLPNQRSSVPSSSKHLAGSSWVLSGSSVYHNSNMLQENYTHSLDRMQVCVHLLFDQQCCLVFKLFVKHLSDACSSLSLLLDNLAQGANDLLLISDYP